MALLLLMHWWQVAAVRRRLADWWRIQLNSKLLLLLVTAALRIVHFAAPGEFWEYQIPGYLLAVVLLAAMSTPLTQGEDHRTRALLLALCVVISAAPVWIFRSPELWGPTNTLLNASKASEILAQRGRAGNTLLGEFNHLALASGLQVYPGNEMGRFSVADGSTPAETTARHLLSKEAVTEALASCSAAFAVTDKGSLFSISVPSTLDIPSVTGSQWRDMLQIKYRAIYSDGEITIFERSPERCSSTPSVGEEGRAGRLMLGSESSQGLSHGTTL